MPLGCWFPWFSSFLSWFWCKHGAIQRTVVVGAVLGRHDDRRSLRAGLDRHYRLSAALAPAARRGEGPASRQPSADPGAAVRGHFAFVLPLGAPLPLHSF